MFIKYVFALIVFTAIGKNSFAGGYLRAFDSTITIKVKGVTCSNDLKTLAANVMELKGVSNCTPGKAGPTSVFKITYNPSLVGNKEIFKAIEDTGGCSDPNDRPYKVKSN